jgi:pectate lyase-like protein
MGARPGTAEAQTQPTGTGQAASDTGYINVRSFGATSDDSTADDMAFRKALASAKGPRTLLVPGGRYIFLQGISLENDVTLVGEGESSILAAGEGVRINLVRNADPKGGNSNITIQNLRLEGNAGSSTGGNPLVLHHVDGGRISRVHVLNGPEAGIVIRKSTAIAIEDSIVEGAGNDNVHVWDGSSNITINRVTARGSTGSVTTALSTGFEIADGAHDVALIDCQTSGNRYAGITIHNHNEKQVGRDTHGPFNITVRRFVSTSDKVYAINVLAQAPDGPANVILEDITVKDVGKKPINVAMLPGLVVPNPTITDLKVVPVSGGDD